MEQAFKILEAALNSANKAGVFNLQESAAVYQAYAHLKGFVEEQSQDKEVKSTKK